MSLSTERQRRIVTTHVGSLPRPMSLSAQLLARMSGRTYDADALAFGAEGHEETFDTSRLRLALPYATRACRSSPFAALKLMLCRMERRAHAQETRESRGAPGRSHSAIVLDFAAAGRGDKGVAAIACRFAPASRFRRATP